MDMNSIGYFLAVWGAVVSTALAIPKLLEFRYTVLRNLRIRAEAEPPFESLNIVISNEGRRPISIVDIEILYGLDPEFSDVVDKMEREGPKKLEEGDAWKISVPREELIRKASENVTQKYHHRLWVQLKTAPGKRINRVVYVDPAIIPVKYPKEAEFFLASDVFLGFKPLTPHIPKIPHK